MLICQGGFGPVKFTGQKASFEAQRQQKRAFCCRCDDCDDSHDGLPCPRCLGGGWLVCFGFWALGVSFWEGASGDSRWRQRRRHGVMEHRRAALACCSGSCPESLRGRRGPPSPPLHRIAGRNRGFAYRVSCNSEPRPRFELIATASALASASVSITSSPSPPCAAALLPCRVFFSRPHSGSSPPLNSPLTSPVSPVTTQLSPLSPPFSVLASRIWRLTLPGPQPAPLVLSHQTNKPSSR